MPPSRPYTDSFLISLCAAISSTGISLTYKKESKVCSKCYNELKSGAKGCDEYPHALKLQDAYDSVAEWSQTDMNRLMLASLGIFLEQGMIIWGKQMHKLSPNSESSIDWNRPRQNDENQLQ